MKKLLAATLLMGLAFSASAENPNPPTQNQHLQFYFTPFPYTPSNFYCDAQPSVSYLSFTLNNVYVSGFDGNTKIFTDNVSNLFNSVYFNAGYITFTGAPALIEIEYKGSADDVACFNGRGTRTVAYP